MTGTINLAAKLELFDTHWSPHTLTTFNGHDVMVAKIVGAFAWHHHDDTDDFFMVLTGEIDIEMRDRTVHLQAGELFVVPKGVEHRPVAQQEAHILLIERTGTPNSGDPATAAPRRLI